MLDQYLLYLSTHYCLLHKYLLYSLYIFICYLGIFTVRSRVKQGGVLSPPNFNACIVSVLSGIQSTCFRGFCDLSCLAYTDYLLLVIDSKTIAFYPVSGLFSLEKRIVFHRQI